MSSALRSRCVFSSRRSRIRCRSRRAIPGSRPRRSAFVGTALREFQHGDARLPAPAQPSPAAHARRQRLVHGCAIDHVAGRVPGLGRGQRCVIVGQRAIGVILDQRHLLAFAQRHQPGFPRPASRSPADSGSSARPPRRGCCRGSGRPGPAPRSTGHAAGWWGFPARACPGFPGSAAGRSSRAIPPRSCRPAARPRSARFSASMQPCVTMTSSALALMPLASARRASTARSSGCLRRHRTDQHLWRLPQGADHRLLQLFHGVGLGHGRRQREVGADRMGLAFGDEVRTRSWMPTYWAAPSACRMSGTGGMPLRRGLSTK